MTRIPIAVVGSGPSGIYAAERLLARNPDVVVDMFEASHTPYGLVRYGVAPDHQKIKSVTRVFDRTLTSDRVRWFGDVVVGGLDGRGPSTARHLTMRQLRDRYRAVVIATGAPRAIDLDVPGTGLGGYATAADLVRWYNAHPAAPDPTVRTARDVVVIGGGNVALDVARVLLKAGSGLQDSDTPESVLQRLDGLGVRHVHIVARRGPESAKFGVAELAAFAELPAVAIDVAQADLGHLDPDDDTPNLKRLRGWAAAGVPDGKVGKTLSFHFGLSPKRLRGRDRVEAVEFEPTPGQLIDRPGLSLDAGLVVPAIGFRSAPIPGVPFDSALGRIPHLRGRVEPGLYVVGWAKRGPQGVIGTNKADAIDTVATLLQDLPALPPGPAESDDIEAVLVSGPGVPAPWQRWLAVDAAEVRLGRRRGVARVKIPAVIGVD